MEVYSFAGTDNLEIKDSSVLFSAWSLGIAESQILRTTNQFSTCTPHTFSAARH